MGVSNTFNSVMDLMVSSLLFTMFSRSAGERLGCTLAMTCSASSAMIAAFLRPNRRVSVSKVEAVTARSAAPASDT